MEKKKKYAYLQLHEKYPSIVKHFHFNFCLLKMENNTRSEVQQERLAQGSLGNSLLNQMMSCDSVLAQRFPSVLPLQFQEKRNLCSEPVDAVHALCFCNDHTELQLNMVWPCMSSCACHTPTFPCVTAVQSGQAATGEVWVSTRGVLECPWLLTQHRGVEGLLVTLSF